MSTASSAAGTVTGPRLAVETCARRLAPMPTGAWPPVETTISWCGPATSEPGRSWSEATIQARCGLMAVHGWDAGHPRRIGLEVASVAAGLMAAQGTLAARIGALRTGATPAVETSVLSAGLWLVAHHLAAASSGGELLPSPPGPEPGPPFRTGDHRWFEIEVFDAEAWRSFWTALGAGEADLGRAWTSFRARYYRGRCTLPPGLRSATEAATLAEVTEVASATGVSLCPVRSYAEVLERPGLGPTRPGAGRLPPEPADGPTGALPPRRPALPLEGVRVVEATNRMQGPLAGLLLQMLGAEVVRVEPPGGDPGRMVPPVVGDTGSFFLCYNRGKEAVQLDLARPAGRADLVDLLATSDAFLHNWRPGKATEWGLDAGTVGPRLPQLVHVEATGWHPAQDVSHLIGTDFLVQAYSGFAEGLSPVGEPPLSSRALLTDTLGALATCEGVLAALYARQITGRGGEVRTSLLQGAMAGQAHVLESLAEDRDLVGRSGGRPVWGALDRPVHGADGSLVVTSETDEDLLRLCELCKVDAAGARPAVEAAVADRLATGSGRHWEDLVVAAGIPCRVVATDLAALAADDGLGAMLEPLAGTCRAPASPWRFTW